MSAPKERYDTKSRDSDPDWAWNQVTRWFDSIISSDDYEGHDAILARILKLEWVKYTPTRANPNDSRSMFSFVVPKELCNAGGNLHGGAVALIFDITTSVTIGPCMKENFWDTGNVSRTRNDADGLGNGQVNCTYLKPAPEGSTVFVESWVSHLGKRMGQTMGTMRLDSQDGKLCYSCEHGKASVGQSNL